MQPKVVLITGASSGIGWETAKFLMLHNIKIYAASRRPERTKTEEIKKLKITHPNCTGEIIPIKIDVNEEKDIKSALSTILNENTTLDAVICNAGNGIAGSIEDTSMEEIKYQFETNFFGTVKTIQACLPIFRKQGHGKIITTSSVAAIVPLPFQAFYSASKSALSIFIEALYMETKHFGIQCCNILPGDTKTEFTSSRKYTNHSQSIDSIYTKKLKKAIGKMEKDELNGMEAKFIAKKITNQLIKNRMKIKVIPGFQYKFLCFIYNILPLKLKLWAVEKLY